MSVNIEVVRIPAFVVSVVKSKSPFTLHPKQKVPSAFPSVFFTSQTSSNEDEDAARGDPVHHVGGIVLTKQAHPKVALRGLKQQDLLHQQSASGVGEIA